MQRTVREIDGPPQRRLAVCMTGQAITAATFRAMRQPGEIESHDAVANPATGRTGAYPEPDRHDASHHALGGRQRVPELDCLTPLPGPGNIPGETPLQR